MLWLQLYILPFLKLPEFALEWHSSHDTGPPSGIVVRGGESLPPTLKNLSKYLKKCLTIGQQFSLWHHNGN